MTSILLEMGIVMMRQILENVIMMAGIAVLQMVQSCNLCTVRNVNVKAAQLYP